MEANKGTQLVHPSSSRPGEARFLADLSEKSSKTARHITEIMETFRAMFGH